MTSFSAAGTDLARALDNALLFSDKKAEVFPGVILVQMSPTGVRFVGHDDYATGSDFVGPIEGDIASFSMYDDDAVALVKMVRSARKSEVTLRMDACSLYATVGDETLEWPVFAPDPLWWKLDELYLTDEPLPNVVSFNPARLTRFGRVKGAKDAPIDIKFHMTESGAPVALVKVGPTFNGQLQGVNRTIAKEFINDDNCFW